MIYLPDVNFWVALASDKHIHHPIAKEWFIRVRDERIAFCRVTEMGFLRLLTNRHVMGEDMADPKRAWHIYDELCADRRIVFAEEPHGLSEKWRSISLNLSGGPSMWTDAYLAAFAYSCEASLVTFDRGLRVVPNVKILPPPPSC